MDASILHLVKSKSLRNDGRILKWFESMEAAGMESDVISLDASNHSEEYRIGKTKVKTIQLYTRKLFPKRGSGQFLKVPEFSLRVFLR